MVGATLLAAALAAALALGGCVASAAPETRLPEAQLRALATQVSTALGQPSGIAVSGQGTVSADPDLAVLVLGVEARGRTVAAARDDAAAAMGRVVDALRAQGVTQQDVQTRHFSIRPEYRYDAEGREQVLVGYVVTNTVTARVRDLESVGRVVDATVAAGGDATRIQSIGFTVEEATALEAQARHRAVQDALARAGQLATLTGVELGVPLYVSESVGFTYPPGFREGAGAPDATPISPGQVDVRVTVQAVFAIK